MTKEYIEDILVEYGVTFTDSLASRLLKEFQNEILGEYEKIRLESANNKGSSVLYAKKDGE